MISLIKFLMVIDDPEKDPQARGDPYRTLFVARLNYDVKESDLEREFGRFGPIERVRRSCHIRSCLLSFFAHWSLQIRIVKDTVSEKAAKKPHRGYAFVVYEREKDMKGIITKFIASTLAVAP